MKKKKMLIYYIIGIIVFGALAAYCGVQMTLLLSQESSKEMQDKSKEVLDKIDELGLQIQRDKAGIKKDSEIVKVEEEYKKLATDFFENLPLKAAEKDARTAEQKVRELQKTQELKTYFTYIENEARKFAEAYNEAYNDEIITISASALPKNIYQPDKNDTPAHILINFKNKIFWVIRITQYPDRTLAIQYVRVLPNENSQEYEKMSLTNDSINLVISEEQFGMSLNSQISEDVKENVADNLSVSLQPLNGNFETFSSTLLKRIIEYALLSLKEKDH